MFYRFDGVEDNSRNLRPVLFVFAPPVPPVLIMVK